MTVVLTIIHHDSILVMADRATTNGIMDSGMPITGPDEMKIFVSSSNCVVAVAGQKTVLRPTCEIDLSGIARAAAEGRDPQNAASEVGRQFELCAEEVRQGLPAGWAASLTAFERPIFSAVVIAGLHTGSPEIAVAGLTFEGPCEARNMTLQKQFVLAPVSVRAQLEEVCQFARSASTANEASSILGEGVREACRKEPFLISADADVAIIRPLKAIEFHEDLAKGFGNPRA